MLTNAIPANATALPALIGTSAKSVRSDTFQLDAWAEAIGQTVADVAALVFVLPMPAHYRPVFEDAIRQEVAAELFPFDLPATEVAHAEEAAWSAFARRLDARDRQNQTTRRESGDSNGVAQQLLAANPSYAGF